MPAREHVSVPRGARRRRLGRYLLAQELYHDPDYTQSIQEIGVEVIYGPRFVGKFSDFLRGRSGSYDAVLLSRPHVAVHFIDDVRTLTNARVLYYGHDVHFERMKAQKEVAGSTIEEDAVEAMRALELTLVRPVRRDPLSERRRSATDGKARCAGGAVSRHSRISLFRR